MTRPKADQADRDHEPTWRAAVAAGRCFAVWCAGGGGAIRPSHHQYHATLNEAERQRDALAASENHKVATAWIEEYRDHAWKEIPNSRRTGQLRGEE